MTDTAQVARWMEELDRLERVLGCVGPDEVCCEGLTPRQTGILRILTQRQGATLSELAAAAGLSPSALTRVLEKLEQRGLVQRVRGSQPDGRAAVVAITPRGRKTRGRIDELMRERMSAILQAVPAAQRDAVLEALRTLNTALEQAKCCIAVGR